LIRKVGLIAVIGVAAALSASPAAQGSTWPANCTTWKCVNGHLNLLHAKDVALTKSLNKLAWVNPCLDNIAPITAYSGYYYDDGAGGFLLTTALDYTTTGEIPDYWALMVDPGCAPAVAAVVRPGTTSSFGGHTFHVVSPRVSGRHH
jgi:hypothetical protein